MLFLCRRNSDSTSEVFDQLFLYKARFDSKNKKSLPVKKSKKFSALIVSAQYVGVSSYYVVFLNKFIILTNNFTHILHLAEAAPHNSTLNMNY